jgi:ATP-dependent RNA helicase DeaD
VQNFKESGLSNSILKALKDLEFDTPTEIQQLCLTHLLQKKSDLLGLSQTGTGKTAAFGLPLVEYALQGDTSHLTSLVLAPTRELALQITQNLEAYSKYEKGIKIETVYGGVSITNQITAIKKGKPTILVATPGRLLDLLRRKVVNFSNLNNVVLDEADEMLSMGFQEDIDQILSSVPAERNIWLFSATMPAAIKKLSKKYMNDPVHISSKGGENLNENLVHKFVLVEPKRKFDALCRIVETNTDFYGVIFCRTKAETTKIAERLRTLKYDAEAINGDMTQSARETVMGRFKKKQTTILVATDVAARGIDVNNLTHVLHYSLPDDDAYYTHRSGRTARAGKEGVSIVILDPRDRRKLKFLERKLDIDFIESKIPSKSEVLKTRIENRSKEIERAGGQTVPDELLEAYLEQFSHLNNEALLLQLISADIAKITDEIPGREEDLNYKGKVGSDRGKGEKAPRKRRKGDPSDVETMFINVGRTDGFNKGSIMNFIQENTGVSNGAIGQIQIQDRISFVEVANREADSFLEGLKNKKHNGRKLRVNNDADPIQKGRGNSGGRGKKFGRRKRR